MELKSPLCISAMWHSLTWFFLTRACWTPNLSSNTEFDIFHWSWGGRPDSSRLAPLSFFLSDLLLAYVKLWWTWAEHERLLYWLCDAAVGPNSAFDVLILSQWCQSTSAAVILPPGSALRPVWKIDWPCLSKTHILSLVQVRDSWVFFSSLSVNRRRAAYIDWEWDFSVMQIEF